MAEIDFDADVIARANHSDWWMRLEVAAHSALKKNFVVAEVLAVELFVLSLTLSLHLVYLACAWFRFLEWFGGWLRELLIWLVFYAQKFLPH